MIRLDSLTPAPWNPRKKLAPSDPEYQRIKRSLEEFGLCQELVVSRKSKQILAGNQRWQVLQDMGVKTVPESDIRFVALPNEQSEKRLAIALNNNPGIWDDAVLIDLLTELLSAEERKTHDALGFDPVVLRSLMANQSADTSPQLAAAYEYKIIITAESEEHQKKLLAKFTKEGYACQAFIV